MSKTDLTVIDGKGDLRVRAVNVKGTRVSAPDKLSTQTIVDTPNGKELAEKIDINTYIDDIPGLQEKLDALDASDNSLQNQINQNHTAILNESSARANADATLQTKISENKADLITEIARATTAENTISGNLTQEVANRTAADNALDGAMVKKSVVPTALVDLTLTNGSTSATLVKTSKNTDTGANSQSSIPLPIADINNVGLAHPSLVQTVADNSSDIATLKGASKRYPVHLGTDPLTQAQYQSAWEIAARVPAGTTPPDGATLVNLDNNHAITYFENANIDKWKDRGVDTVDVATNSQAGIVKGSTNPGQIFVESDGSMSMNGYDQIVANDSDMAADIAELQSEVATKADADNVYDKTEIDSALVVKVDKETGKGLSTNDFTNEEKIKLAGIAPGGGIPAGVISFAPVDSLPGHIIADGVMLDPALFSNLFAVYGTKFGGDGIISIPYG